MKYKDRILTRHLSMVPMSAEKLQKQAKDTSDPLKRAQIEHTLSDYKSGLCPRLRHTFWIISLKKEKEPLGFVQFGNAPADRNIEINLTLYHPEKQERYASEALKGAVKWAFSEDKSLKRVTTWLNRDLTAVRILEKAGFERVFESGGLVRYEKHRQSISFLALFMFFGTLSGMSLGYFTGNYPVCTALGICAGILPGSLIDAAMRKHRK